MWQVNMYLETDSTCQHSKKRHSGVVLEYRKKDGNPVTRELYFTREATYNQTVLQDIIEGLEQLKTGCEICIYTENRYIASGIGRLPDMAAADFRNAKGQPLKNREEWKLLYSLAGEHRILARTEKHSYSGQMKEQMKEQQERKTEEQKKGD